MNEEAVSKYFVIFCCFFLMATICFVVNEKLTTPKPCDKEYVNYCIKKVISNEQYIKKELIKERIELCNYLHDVCAEVR